MKVMLKEYLKHKYVRLIRLDKPTGIYLALLPALWAVALSAKTWGMLLMYSLIMLIGAIAARSAGCIINDLFDKNIDAKVARTKRRPLASGEVSQNEAYMLLAICSLVSLMLLLILPNLAIYAGLIAIPMIIIYPLLKRISFYPQIFLGFAFNIGVFIGWFAVSPKFSYQAVMLYAASILWTIGYDTIYGHQDRKDDDATGVKSLSLKLGEKTPDTVWNLYKLMIVFIIIAAMGRAVNLLFYAIMACATYYLYWQTSTLDINNPKDCNEKFKSNVHIGIMIWIAILIGRI